MSAHKIVAAVAGLTLVAGACGSAASEGSTATTATTEAPVPPATDAGTTPPTTALALGGWIGFEPDWGGGSDGAVTAVDASGDAAYGSAGSDGDDSVRFESEAVGKEAPIPVEPDGGSGGGTGGEGEPVPIEAPPLDAPPVDPGGGYDPDDPGKPVDRPVDNTPLRAGSVDDNADYQGFLDYIARIQDLGIALRDFDASGRTVVTVTGSNGLPVSGVEVVADAGGSAITLRTTADGTVRFLPWYAGSDAASQAEVTFSVAEVSVSAAAGTDVELVVAQPGGTQAPVPLDILFLLDATGSMSDEIDRLKTTIDLVAERVAALDPAPDVRFAMTLYRDEGDAFVTANYDFTGDIDEFQEALAGVVADGGGDYPEALDEGLADALAKPSWRDPSEAVQLIFVVADAPPQVGRQLQTPYTESIRDAVERGVKIFPVASSESDDQAEAVFRQMAQATGAPFVFLSNGASGASVGGSTDIQSTDYEELALDELVVRLVAEELSDLNGDGDVTVPTTIAPATTNPEGQ